MADGFSDDPGSGGVEETKCRFALSSRRLFWVAGLIKDGAFAMLTTEP